MATPDQLVLARDLGARGSRDPLAEADPAGTRNSSTDAVLAAIPGWWERRAAAAGLSGPWLDVEYAVDAQAITDAGLPQALTIDDLSTEQLGETYVASLDARVKSRHGRHYTPALLAEELW